MRHCSVRSFCTCWYTAGSLVCSAAVATREAHVVDFNETIITGVPPKNSASALTERTTIHGTNAGSVTFDKIGGAAGPGAHGKALHRSFTSGNLSMAAYAFS